MVCLVLLAGGCAATGATLNLPSATQQQRVDAVANRLAGELRTAPVRVSVGSSRSPAAYAWPDGRVLVTRGLVELLDDDELAAAVAHEMGHLLDDGHLKHVVALRRTGGEDAEARADALGVALLERFGYAPDAMARMLAKVARTRGISPACRARLKARVHALPAPPGAGSRIAPVQSRPTAGTILTR